MSTKSKKILNIVLAILLALIIAVSIILCIAYSILSIRTSDMDDDYSSIYSDSNYSTAVNVDGVEIITQSVSCEYAVIEMFSSYKGGNVTEERLYAEYGKVVTTSGKSFCAEFNKRFPEYKTTMYKYLKNTQLVDKVYKSLADGIPVPFEWAAKHNGAWTLHYSLVVGMDIKNDKIFVANPYGYKEEITLKEFLDRTSFRAFEKMPISYSFAFAFGVFEMNTVFIPVAT